MLRWQMAIAVGGLLLAGPVRAMFAQTGYQAERLAPDPVLKTPATLESMLMRAGYEQRHQDCLDAGFHLNAVLKREPDWSGAWAMRLVCERQENHRIDEAADLTTLIKLQPRYWRWWSDRALVHEKDFDRQAALTDLNQAILLRPWEIDLYVRRSYLEEDLRDYEKAYADLAKVHELLPEQAGPLLQMAARVVLFGGTEAEAARLRKLAEIAAPKPEDSPRNDEDLYTDGMSAEEAMLRAGYAKALGRWELELRFLNAALSASSGLTRAAELRLELGMLHPDTKSIARYYPRHIAYTFRDRVAERQRREEEQRRFTLTRDLDPLSDVSSLIGSNMYRAEYHRLRIELLSRTGRQGLNPIKQDLDAIVQWAEPYEARSYAERAQFEMEQNELDDSAGDFMDALDLEPANAGYSYQLSRVYALQKIISTEITSLNLALVGEPENDHWLRERARLP